MNKAKNKLIEFMDAWKEHDSEAMFKASQVTWQKDGGSVNRLKQTFCNTVIQDYSIVGITIRQKGILVDYKVRVKINNKWSEPANVRLLCEEKSFKLSKKGEWGVNPISAISLFHKMF